MAALLSRSPELLSLKNYRLLAEHNADLVIRAGKDHRLKYISPSCQRILGWTQEEALALATDSVVYSEDMPLFHEAAQRILQNPGETVSLVFRLKKKDGQIIWVEGASQLVSSGDPETAGDVISTVRDISRHHHYVDVLRTQANTDGLTALANRRVFDETLEREWRRSVREQNSLALILLDVDHFKGYNDTYGHSAGDDCLRRVAEAVRSHVQRPGDLAARYGGEEFAVILPNTTPQGAVSVAEEIRQAILALQIPHKQNPEGEEMVSASFGVASVRCRECHQLPRPQFLLHAVDSALYQAKREGRNRVVLAAAQNLSSD